MCHPYIPLYFMEIIFILVYIWVANWQSIMVYTTRSSMSMEAGKASLYFYCRVKPRVNVSDAPPLSSYKHSGSRPVHHSSPLSHPPFQRHMTKRREGGVGGVGGDATGKGGIRRDSAKSNGMRRKEGSLGAKQAHTSQRSRESPSRFPDVPTLPSLVSFIAPCGN